MVRITLESEMESNLINELCSGVSQWTRREDIKNENDLWNNLREKLNRNNIDRLEGIPLTDGEMAKVKEFLLDQCTSTYKAARWLSGEHQVAQIPLLRDDASLGQVSLIAINNREIAGGLSSYEVIHQYNAPKDEHSDRDRRFDVTLLINGLPMIHIELKSQRCPFMDAFRQIKKYGEEGKFRGLMGLVQMYVVTNGANTRYIAADNFGNINEKFLTSWVNEFNEPVEEYLPFAKAALNIPFAHMMVGKYSVLDNERKKVILLRPYQIHAIEAVKKASYERESGFVWHTTGSGKTLTSYTVTKNLLDIPSLDKAIFLIDRRDLDQQTTASFLSYADSDDVEIRNTDHTADLENKLKSNDRCVIITTVQKLQTLIRKLDENKEKKARVREQISKKSIAFVVDECHRAVTPESKRIIDKFFAKTLWYGFTGTPIFEENKREQKGDLPRTTAGMYGRPKDPNKKCLHAYTIKEAIHNNAVLGFKIQGMGFRRSTLEEIASKLGLYSDTELELVDDKTLEKEVIKGYAIATNKSIYDDDQYRLEVIDYIVNQSRARLALNHPSGEAFEGLLTVSSIEEAQKYYELFKQFKEDGNVSQKICQMLPDFPKIAITYTVGENEDGARANQEKMALSLADYNEMFGTSWDLSTLDAYNRDLNDRLARKKSKYKERSQQLDLVIVVDRLLTGFDAPCLSTIFLARPPMKPQHLIQALSRTNRIFTKDKRFGHVVTMQTPEKYEAAIEDALRLYTNGGMDDVQAPSWIATAERLKAAVDKLKKLAPTTKHVDDLIAHGVLEELKEYARAFQAVDRVLSEAQVYDEFDEDSLQEDFGIDRDEFDTLTGKYHNVIEKIKELTSEKDGDEDPLEIDVNYELETIKLIEVNFNYLVALLQAHMPEGDELALAPPQEDDERISKLISDYQRGNPKVGMVIGEMWNDVKANPEDFRNKNAFVVMEERVDNLINREIDSFAHTWGIEPKDLKMFVNTVPSTELAPSTVDQSMGNYEAYKKAGGTDSKIRYLRGLRDAVVDFVKNEIHPLTAR